MAYSSGATTMKSPWSGETKYRALLAVSEAANSRLQLSSVLDEVAVALRALVPIDAIGIISGEGRRVRALAAHSGRDPRRDHESDGDYVRRLTRLCDIDSTAPQLLSELERKSEPIIIEDALADPRVAEGSSLRQGEGGSLVAVRLAVRDHFVGVIVFARTAPVPFSREEVLVLEDLCRPVASAVANALAFEEIHALRVRLEDENLALKEEIDLSVAAGGIIGASSGLQSVLDRAQRVAPTDSTVLITGETGTGKELVARAIHQASPRAGRAMIKVNCASFAEGLVASELFGHEKGAFTGAVERRRGRFELADKGTIFLDEVGELPPAVQVTLLRILQEGEFERVGGSQTIRTDARVVAATNRNLERAVADGHLRSDLFFRLNVFPIHLPPLRDRAQDIPVIAEYYALHYGRKIGKSVRGISADGLAKLSAYSWPGNVRELQNVVERAVILTRGSQLEAAAIEITNVAPAAWPGARWEGSDAERRRIVEALAASHGRVAGAGGAAETLGLPSSTLEWRIRRLGVDKLEFRPRVRGTAR